MKRLFSSHMTLIELTPALFFLMLAMATIMGMFTKAYGMSCEAERLTQVVQYAQSCAALIESSEDPMALLAEHGYKSRDNHVMTRRIDENTMVSAELDQEQTEVGILFHGTISVEAEDKVIVTWPVARYIIRK